MVCTRLALFCLGRASPTLLSSAFGTSGRTRVILMLFVLFRGLSAVSSVVVAWPFPWLPLPGPVVRGGGGP